MARNVCALFAGSFALAVVAQRDRSGRQSVEAGVHDIQSEHALATDALAGESADAPLSCPCTVGIGYQRVNRAAAILRLPAGMVMSVRTPLPSEISV